MFSLLGKAVYHCERGSPEGRSIAILTNPDNGELLSEYDKLVWNVHCDGERSPIFSGKEQCHAIFPWDTKDVGGPEVNGTLGYAGFAPEHATQTSPLLLMKLA